MATATAHELVSPTQGITCHAWNADGTKLAVSPNNHEIHIYAVTPGTAASSWRREHVLGEHDLVVCGLAWCPVSNRIVSCSHDRNAFVWSFDDQENAWKPSLVLLRIDRAALMTQWSPDGSKFAVSSAAKCVPVCHYEPEQDWWPSKMVRKHKSTVLCVTWHPNSQIIATGSSDFKCRVISAYVSEVDEAQDSGPFDAPVPFAEPYVEFSAHGWVHAVAFSPSGNTLAFAGHDSSVHFVTFGAGGEHLHQTIRFPQLPITTLLFLSERGVVGAGHDMNPMVFAGDASNWAYVRNLDEKTNNAPKAKASTGIAAARALFQNRTQRGQDTSSSNDESNTLWTKHQNAITCMQRTGDYKFSTTALDGRLVEWNVNANQLGI